MIIIAGDSWGCGEWEDMKVTHGGLAQYLQEDGHKTINLSLGGSSNWEIYERIQLFFASGIPNYLIEDIDLILVFQTEWNRDFDQKRSTCTNQRYGMNAVSCWQYRLSEIAINNNVKIGIIGGCSDTMFLDKFEHEYPGLFIACQSLTNLCVNNDHRINDPTIIIRPAEDHLKQMKDYCRKSDCLDQLLIDLDKGKLRHSVWSENKKYFYPDGVHPNRLGHKILFDFLKSTGVIHEHS